MNIWEFGDEERKRNENRGHLRLKEKETMVKMIPGTSRVI